MCLELNAQHFYEMGTILSCSLPAFRNTQTHCCGGQAKGAVWAALALARVRKQRPPQRLTSVSNTRPLGPGQMRTNMAHSGQPPRHRPKRYWADTGSHAAQPKRAYLLSGQNFEPIIGHEMGPPTPLPTKARPNIGSQLLLAASASDCAGPTYATCAIRVSRIPGPKSKSNKLSREPFVVMLLVVVGVVLALVVVVLAVALNLGTLCRQCAQK